MQLKISNQIDNTIIFEHQGVFDDIPACYQSWQCDGFSGESILFKKNDLKKQPISNLIKKVRASKLAQTHKPITVSHNPPGHVCVIFNFNMGL